MLYYELNLPEEAQFGQPQALLQHHIVSSAASMAIECFEWPINVGYDSIEASLSRLKLSLDVLASLQRRR
eukprot:12422221-Karenia_brevis.AAC.1